MFRGLRLRLTALYLATALVLLALVGAGAYRIVGSYFQSTTDLALQHMVAHDIRAGGGPVPPALQAADSDWYARQNQPVPVMAGLSPTPGEVESVGEEQHEDSHDAAGTAPHPSGPGQQSDEAFDGELAAIFVLARDAQGTPLPQPTGVPAAPMAPDAGAVAAARAQGSDLRTISLPSGSQARLFTYALPAGNSPAVLQVGRLLDDQNRVLNQLLLALLGLGTVAAVLLGIGSWLLAGRALRPAQAAWTRQQGFVANASHELRTPLTLLRASAEVVLRGLPAADADRRELLGDVLNETDHMSRLVEDLLLLSRLDAGRLAVTPEPVILGDLLGDMERQMGRVATERGLTLSVGSAEGVAQADPTRLRQVLLIVLDNALRHTPAGGRVTLEAGPAHHGVQIRVTDTGSGIPAEHLQRVFERFYRADDARGTGGGTGLGLAIARGLVEAQHGHIALTSQAGTGTQVAITLPAARGA